MPKGVVETPSQEKKWEKAKEVAAEQGKSKRWPLIMHIFKQMGGMSKADQDHQNVLVERALAAQGKKTTIPQEAHEALHSWWQSNKDKVLSPEQKQKVKDIQSVKAKRTGMRLVKNAEYLQSLQTALSALKSELVEALSKADDTKKSYRRQWSQHPEHTPQELAQMQKLIQEGYHPREAAHMVSIKKVGSNKRGRGEAETYDHALRSQINPTELSPKVLERLRPMAAQLLEAQKAREAESLVPEENPELYAQHKRQQAHHQVYSDYNKAYENFLGSDELKTSSPEDKVKRISEWKKNWHRQNAERNKEILGSAKAGQVFQESREARRQRLNEEKQRLALGFVRENPRAQSEDLDQPEGIEEPVEGIQQSESQIKESEKQGIKEDEPSSAGSAAVAAQHMGYKSKDDDDEKGSGVSEEWDPYSLFQQKHGKYIESVLKPEVQAAQAKAKPQAQVSATKPAPQAQAEAGATPAPAPEKPKVVIRRAAKPDQIERMQRVDAAKMALQTKKD